MPRARQERAGPASGPLARHLGQAWGTGWKKTLALCFLGIALTGPSMAASPQSPASVQSPARTDQGLKGRESGLKVPRFVSLRSREARMRVGPSLDYGIAWIYRVPGLPLEIIEEYGNWRQVRDSDGVSGWMHRALLSGKRTAMIGPWAASNVSLRAEPRSSARTLASLAARVRLAINTCDGSWCDVEVPGHDLSGFVRQTALWGVYPNETIK
ncbi:SH3 domain-containing protein [Rhizobium metallidurans]|uniref:SH3-like domain-containing protein n=1 Tax=Rhizobium metallidurans TaxID=1265931 RepID=A0A7W6CR14_9HYPH|nr:SH3 domain-containing protein [Rhizobium metallidurans]MBB3964861.1 SH3-like domain-containing protein [Rhizobium metallidurans]